MLIIPYPTIIPTVILSTGKTQLLPYLKGHDLLGFSDGSNPCPLSTVCVNNVSTPTLVCPAWTRQDQLLMSLLIILDEITPLLDVGFSSSKEIWTTLKRHLPLLPRSNTHIFVFTRFTRIVN